MSLQMSRNDLNAFMREFFPEVAGDIQVVKVAEASISVEMQVGAGNLRPGGTVSGPTMFTLADVTIYLAILAMIGPQALAVTTNCSIDFMRKPAAGRRLRADGRILKLGQALAVGDVLVFSEGMGAPVARASLTYSIPPQRAAKTE